jgi:hypothetical protein
MTFIGATTGAVYRTFRNLTGWFDMSLRFLLPLTIALGGALPAAAQDYPPQYGYAQSGYDTDGQSVDSIEVFFDPLSRYGRWIDSRFGRAWGPNVGRDWRPYTIGHWRRAVRLGGVSLRALGVRPGDRLGLDPRHRLGSGLGRMAR